MEPISDVPDWDLGADPSLIQRLGRDQPDLVWDQVQWIWRPVFWRWSLEEEV